MDKCVLIIIPKIENGESKHIGVFRSTIGKSMSNFCDIMLISKRKMIKKAIILALKLCSNLLAHSLK